jgi:hypothetical protein
MKKLLFIILIVIVPIQVWAQETDKVWRVIFLNPGVEYELPISSTSVISTHLGIGYSGSYPNLTENSWYSGWIYSISPFVSLQFKKFYKINSRSRKNRDIKSNSGNFISIRFLSRGPAIEENFVRKGIVNFAIGPTWGLQRSYGNFHLLFDVGPQFYFDDAGNTGIWPLMPRINFGFNL